MKRKKQSLNRVTIVCLAIAVWTPVSAFVNKLNATHLYNFQCFSGSEIDEYSKNFLMKSSEPFYLQVSDRVTHQLLTRIFAIFLHELLGYNDVHLYTAPVFNERESRKLFRTLHSMLVDPVDPRWYVSRAVIDLEVWMKTDFFRGSIPPQVHEYGASTDPGRFGWFVPRDLVRTGSNNTSEIRRILDYSIFLNPANKDYKRYVMDGEILNRVRREFGVEDFVPEHCQNRLQPCATIISGYKLDTQFVVSHIKEKKLFVQVLWVGKKLAQLTKTLYDNNIRSSDHKLFIVLHWTPSEVIDTNIKFDRITMPSCEEIEIRNETLCNYELTPILKYYTEKVREETMIYNALDKFSISKDSLIEMLTSFTNVSPSLNVSLEDIYNQIACDWMKANTDRVSEWIYKDNMTLEIGFILPVLIPLYDNISPAVRSAIQAINANTSILQNIKLNTITYDGECRADSVMKQFIQYFNKKKSLLGIVGPACSDTVEPIAGISKYTHTVIISYSAEGGVYSNRSTYPYFFRTIGSNRQYEAVFIELFKYFKWERVATLTEEGQKYSEYVSDMEKLLRNNSIELIANVKFQKDIKEVDMRGYLETLKHKRSKIIIADIQGENALLVMCEAYKLKMTADQAYVWFLPSWLAGECSNSSDWDPNRSCSKAEFCKAINGHFSLVHTPFAPDSSMMQENRSVGDWLNDFKQGRNFHPSEYAGFAYDAVWSYAIAADKLLREDREALNVKNIRTEKVAKRLAELIWETDFQGVSGRIRFDRSGSRISNVSVLQWAGAEFRKIGEYVPLVGLVHNRSRILSGRLIPNERQITWPLGSFPQDGTFDCDLALLAKLPGVDCDNSVFALIAFVFLFVVIFFSLSSYVFWKRRYDKKLEYSAKIMKSFGIDLLMCSTSTQLTLDKWEVPKDRIVVNRRLGEGAFGTVYGGEVQLKEGGGWTSVAVKTLNVGSSHEDRLDFLSEAECMKRFDHANVVKLLGVSLQSEPIYTIMEFMLHGDLKTFLLGRRSLVDEKCSEDSDISPKRLTLYAMDVARALSYLADNNYVHRDVASRNCLVNAHRVVKLGDFGMARSMFEKDYYKFNRRGMLPIRWMSPEALEQGLFTHSSDVWSFGVLLYEIVTFGSFPYQGMTNHEVLESVKSGKALNIPKDTKPHLEGLFRACWNPDYKKRPLASEIVEYISNYPRLLTPSLDVPTASVEMPETDSDQMELLPKKHSHKQKNLDILEQTSSINNFDENSAADGISIPAENLNVFASEKELPMKTDVALVEGYNPTEPLLKKQTGWKLGSSLSLRSYINVFKDKECNNNKSRECADV